MANPKDVLVTTTSSLEGLKIKRYLKPVSAHIVAGTNLFSDFFASFSDVFGGRSQTYQKQLTSLYNEATERIKLAAYELGANCIVGLSIDMDEISGKGKSMFMLTAIGTAVILEKEIAEKVFLLKSDEKFENVGVDRINILRNKKNIIEKANSNSLILNDEIWSFITANQVDEVFPFLLKKFSQSLVSEHINPGTSDNFYKLLVGYIDGLSEDKKLDILYKGINEEKSEQMALKLSEIIKELNLFDFSRILELLQSGDFSTQKIGLRIVTYTNHFTISKISWTYKQSEILLKILLPSVVHEQQKAVTISKRKEVWTCECGKTNDIGAYCSGCSQDINGFKVNEIKPLAIDNYLKQKIELITEYVE